MSLKIDQMAHNKLRSICSRKSMYLAKKSENLCLQVSVKFIYTILSGVGINAIVDLENKFEYYFFLWSGIV